MRNDLDCFAEVITTTFLLDHGEIDPAGGPVVGLGEVCVREALVVAQVEICFGTVVSDKNFAVLERRHGAGIDVDVRIEFDKRNAQPATLE